MVADNKEEKLLGEWKTQDDETKEEKSHVCFKSVTVENENNKKTIEAFITKLLKLPADTKLRVGRFAGQPVVGSKVIWDLVPYENYWSCGTIIDPMTGSEYGCSVWFENDNYDELFVRGKHWTGLFRTQKWYRCSDNK